MPGYYWDEGRQISLPVPAGGVPGGGYGGGGGLMGGLLGGGGTVPGLLSGGGNTDQLMEALVRRQLEQAMRPDFGKMAAAWAEAAQPSRLPVPMGAVLGKVAGAMGGGEGGDVKSLQALKMLHDMQLAKRKQGWLEKALEGGSDKELLEILNPTGIPGVKPLSSTVPSGGTVPAKPLIPRVPLSDATTGDFSQTYGEPPTGDAGGIDSDLLASAAAPAAPRPLAHLNYGGTGALGDPRAPGWAQANLTTVAAPGGASFRVHNAAAPDIKGFLAELEEKGYPINPQTSGGHALRNIRGGNTLSEHAYGTAVDLNWDKNAYTKDGRLITDLPKDVAQIAAKYNLEWGGNWKSPVDAMHFQWRPGGSAQPQDNQMAAPSVPRVTQAAYTPGSAAKERFLNLAEPLESGGRNVPNYKYGPGATAGGNFQIDDPTWSDFAPPEVKAQYARAMDAPYEVQRAVARRIPVNRWADNNPKLAAAAQNADGLLQTLSAIDPRQSPAAVLGGALPPPDEVIPSGPRPALPGLLQAQYSTVPGVDPSQSPAVALGGGAATPPPMPAVPQAPTGGASPYGTSVPPMPSVPMPANLDPRALQAYMLDLARKSALAEAAGAPNIWGPKLQVLLNSPQYKAMQEFATKGVELQFEGPKTTAKATAERPFLLERDAFKSHLDATNKQIEQLGAAALDPTTILVGDGQGGQREIGATRAQAARAYAGLGVPELGIPARVAPRAGDTGPPAAGTPVGKSIRSPGQTKAEEEMGKSAADALKETHAAELAAGKRLQLYGQMGQAMEGFRPGATAEIRTRAAQVYKDVFGVDMPSVPSAELFQQAARQLQLSAAPKGQGAVSNYERELYASAVPTMVNSPESLSKAIEIARRLDEYDMKVAQIHRQVARDNRGVPDLLEAQDRVARLGPPLSPGEMRALETIREGKVPGTPAPPPASGGVPQGSQQIGTYKGKPVFQLPDGSRKVLE